jgi:hypothetical protein
MDPNFSSMILDGSQKSFRGTFTEAKNTKILKDFSLVSDNDSVSNQKSKSPLLRSE